MIANNKELKTIVECSHKIMYVDEIYNLFSQPQLSHKYPCSFYIYIEKIINFIYFCKSFHKIIIIITDKSVAHSLIEF